MRRSQLGSPLNRHAPGVLHVTHGTHHKRNVAILDHPHEAIDHLGSEDGIVMTHEHHLQIKRTHARQTCQVLDDEMLIGGKLEKTRRGIDHVISREEHSSITIEQATVIVGVARGLEHFEIMAINRDHIARLGRHAHRLACANRALLAALLSKEYPPLLAIVVEGVDVGKEARHAGFVRGIDCARVDALDPFMDAIRHVSVMVFMEVGDEHIRSFPRHAEDRRNAVKGTNAAQIGIAGVDEQRLLAPTGNAIQLYPAAIGKPTDGKGTAIHA